MWAEPATISNLVQGWSQAQLVPFDCGRMCTFTNGDIIALGCITTKAMSTNNVFMFTFVLISHGFPRHGYTVRRKTHIRTKGISVIRHALHELSLRARGAQVQISQQPLWICKSALPIQSQRTTCLPEQTFHHTLHSTGNHTTTPFEVLLRIRFPQQLLVCQELPTWLATGSSKKKKKGHRAIVTLHNT